MTGDPGKTHLFKPACWVILSTDPGPKKLFLGQYFRQTGPGNRPGKSELMLAWSNWTEWTGPGEVGGIMFSLTDDGKPGQES